MRVLHISPEAARTAILAYFASKYRTDIDKATWMAWNPSTEEREMIEVMAEIGYYWRPGDSRFGHFIHPI